MRQKDWGVQCNVWPKHRGFYIYQLPCRLRTETKINKDDGHTDSDMWLCDMYVWFQRSDPNVTLSTRKTCIQPRIYLCFTLLPLKEIKFSVFKIKNATEAFFWPFACATWKPLTEIKRLLISSYVWASIIQPAHEVIMVKTYIEKKTNLALRKKKRSNNKFNSDHSLCVCVIVVDVFCGFLSAGSFNPEKKKKTIVITKTSTKKKHQNYIPLIMYNITG